VWVEDERGTRESETYDSSKRCMSRSCVVEGDAKHCRLVRQTKNKSSQARRNEVEKGSMRQRQWL